MIQGLLLGVPFHSSPMVELPPMPVDEAAIPAKPDPLPDHHQEQAVDALFAQEREQAAMAGLMSAWTTSMLLVEMAKDHLNRPLEEDEEVARTDPEDPPGEFD